MKFVFAISQKTNQYFTYVLSDQQANAQIEVVPECGGLITHWRYQDREILYWDAERFAHPNQPVQGGIPILFPICGSLPHNTYTLNGQTYSLQPQGFARNLPWTVRDRTVENAAAIVLELPSSEQTRIHYPFDFLLRFTYQLQGNRLQLQQQFTNHSDRPMPFSIGLYPHFVAADTHQLTFNLPARRFYDHLSQTEHEFSGQFDFQAAEINGSLQPLSDQQATVYDPQRQLTLTLQWSNTYTILVFWTLRGQRCYCLAPWSAPRNALNTGDHLTILPPGATHQAQVSLQVEIP